MKGAGRPTTVNHSPHWS